MFPPFITLPFPFAFTLKGRSKCDPSGLFDLVVDLKIPSAHRNNSGDRHLQTGRMGAGASST